MKTYYILDNGGRPFKVDIENNNVIVYKFNIYQIQMILNMLKNL